MTLRGRTVAIVQARMGSTRLPGKVLMPLAGEAMVLRVLERAARIDGVEDVLAAIPDLPEDDELSETIAGAGYRVHRGSASDVLSRYAEAAAATRAGTVIRITADCPLLSPRVSGSVLRRFSGCDYASNTIERTYPRGLDTEVMTSDALTAADREARDGAEREHVTPFIWRHPERFRLVAVTQALDQSSMRWTVDTPDDMSFATAVYDRLGPEFEERDVLRLLIGEPQLALLNQTSVQKPIQ